MDLVYLDKLLTILRSHDVTTYKEGDLLLQLSPKMPDFGEPDVSPQAQAGGWKRGASLED